MPASSVDIFTESTRFTDNYSIDGAFMAMRFIPAYRISLKFPAYPERTAMTLLYCIKYPLKFHCKIEILHSGRHSLIVIIFHGRPIHPDSSAAARSTQLICIYGTINHAYGRAGSKAIKIEFKSFPSI